VRSSLTSVDAPEFFIRQTPACSNYMSRTGDSTANMAVIRTCDLSFTFFVCPSGDQSGSVCGEWSDWYALSDDLQQTLPQPPPLPATSIYELSAVFAVASHPANYCISWQVQVGNPSLVAGR